MLQPKTAMGARLRDARLRAGISQQRLADLSGYSASAVASVELGTQDNPTLKVVGCIAKVLGVQPGWLAWGEGSTSTSVGCPRETREKR